MHSSNTPQFSCFQMTKRLLFRVSDKRRNIAAQKMETQNRLFRSHKKVHQPENLTVNQKKETTERKKCRLVCCFVFVVESSYSTCKLKICVFMKLHVINGCQIV